MSAALKLKNTDGIRTVTSQDASTLTPRYNERVLACERSGDGELSVIFHAWKGVETDRGMRVVKLACVYNEQDGARYTVASETWLPMAEPLISRRGNSR